MYAVYFVERAETRLCSSWEQARAYQTRGVLIKKCKSRDEAKRWFAAQSGAYTHTDGPEDVARVLGAQNATERVRAASRKRERDSPRPQPEPQPECDESDFDILASTDGACQSRGMCGRRVASWAVVWHHDAQACERLRLSAQASVLGPDEEHTNQRAELRAFEQALIQISQSAEATPKALRCAIRTDSKWVIQGFTQWMPRLWKRNGFRTVAGKDVRHADVWKRVDALHCAHVSAGHAPVRAIHVRGHSGDRFNEQADRLAVGEVEKHRAGLAAGVGLAGAQ